MRLKRNPNRFLRLRYRSERRRNTFNRRITCSARIRCRASFRLAAFSWGGAGGAWTSSWLGPPGVGKTHRAIGLAIAAIEGGMGAYFMTAQELITDLGEASREGKLSKRLQVYLRPKVLVIDEMGYLPLDSVGATILFQLISARYERGSVILTSNKSYGEWGSIFGDPVLAAAILDRLLHHSTTINIRGNSYRTKDRAKAGLLSAPRKEGENAEG